MSNNVSCTLHIYIYRIFRPQLSVLLNELNQIQCYKLGNYQKNVKNANECKWKHAQQDKEAKKSLPRLDDLERLMSFQETRNE